MNKVRSTIQGMIFTAFFLMLSNSAHAVFQAGVHWGTGFSGGMNGCMADTKAYGRLNSDQKEAVASQELAKAEVAGLKRDIRAMEKELKEKKKKSVIAALFESDAFKDVIESRAKTRAIQEVEIGPDGEFLGADVEGKEFDLSQYGEGYGKCRFADNPDLTEAIGVFTSANFSKTDDGGLKFNSSSNLTNSVVVECLNVAVFGDDKSKHKFSSLTSGYVIPKENFKKAKSCVSKKSEGLSEIPSYVNPELYVNSCDENNGLDFKVICEEAEFELEIEEHKNWSKADCQEELREYFEELSDLEYFRTIREQFTDKRDGYLAKAKDALEDSIKDSEGDVCIDCATQGYARSQEGPSTTDVVIGALAGLTGQYLGLRAYKSAQNKAIDAAAQLGHTMNPTPNFNLYSGLGLSAISAISGIASGAYLCAGAGPYGGVHGMNNPYAMQMAMMGQGGAFGYPFGQAMGNPMMGMYMPGGFGQMGPMGLHTPWHMMGNMNPALMGIMNPYASMMGPMSQFNPMAALGPFGMMGMPGAHMGMQGSFNPYGMMSPYAMMSPFGGLSATAGMGPFAMNPWQMMNPGLLGGAGGMGGLMSCIQAPCPGQMFNPYGMGMGTGGIGGFGGLGGLGGIGGVGGIGGLGAGGIQQQQQWLQMQMQMLQQQQQQQMAYYQQVQQDTQRRMAAAQQLTQLQQQMQQLNMQAAQIASQAGVGGIGGIGGIGGVGGVGVGIGFPNIIGGGGFGFGVGAGFGGGMQYGFPYGLGQFSPNTPTSPRGNGR